MRFLTSIFLLIPILVSAQWDVINNIPKSSMILSLYTENNFAIAGGDSVIYISEDGGLNWVQSGIINNESDAVSAIIRHNDKIFVGTYNHGIYESLNGGKTFEQKNNGLSGLGSLSISCFAIRGDSIYTGTLGAGIFLLDLNHPDQWIPFNDGLYFYVSYSIYSLKNFNGTLYAGAGTSGFLYINEPGTSTWREQLIDTTNYMIIFDMGMHNNTIFLAASNGLFSSRDGGNTFHFIAHNKGSIGDSKLAVYDSTVYIFFRKVQRTFWFTSSDYGTTMNLFEDQPGVDVLSSAIIGNKLFAGRVDGLWFRTLPTTSVDDETMPPDFQLYQNYPNPFSAGGRSAYDGNPSTTIEYMLPNVETTRRVVFTTLKVYDILGREIATLVDEYQQPGKYSVKFNVETHQGASLPSGVFTKGRYASGIYFYQLRYGQYSMIKKMILLK
ncbi:MAG: hypothetical protein AB1521_03860 [Bacteroidota bacterium]